MKTYFLSVLSFVLVTAFSMYSTIGNTQDVSLKVEVSSDSVLIGNFIEVRFTIENAGGDFEAPEFEGFDVLSGPNTSSSFKMINGNVTQKASYSYVVRPYQEGILYIGLASFTTGESILETEPLMVMVHPNPGGIKEDKPLKNEVEEMDFFFKNQDKPKKKKKFEHKKRKI